jgi:hypothetical protein
MNPCIDDFLKHLDEPKATIAYPIRQQYQGKSGTSILGLDPEVCGTAAFDRQIVSPVQVIRRPGLGDKVFALAATYTYTQQNPDIDVTFSGLDNDTWLKQIKWVNIGINHECKSVVNLDNTPPNGGDRTKLMGHIMGVEVEDIRFPIVVPRRKLGITKPYFVFSPFAARRGPRSLPLKTVMSVMSKSPIPIVFVDSLKYDFEIGPNATDCSGATVLDLLVLLDGCEGVISCDTGVPWLGAAIGKPSLVLFSHVPKEDRTQTISNCWGISSIASCSPCGDHVGTCPPCRLKEAIIPCVSYYTPEYVNYMMREFAWMIT